MGTLLTGEINLNDSKTVSDVRTTLVEIISERDSYFPLQFRPSFYFHVPGPRLTSDPGWYVILDGTRSLYVGKATNLKNRLSTNHGSLDQFAKKARTSEPERNLIKKFIEIGIVAEPRVCVIRLSDFAKRFGISAELLSPIDIANIEKFLNIFRHSIRYI